MKKRKICIISSHEVKYSESFIRAHIERLPAEIISRKISIVSKYSYQSHNLHRYLPNPFLVKNSIRVIDFLCLLESKYFKRVLRQYRVQAVLAEYGQTAVTVRESCYQLGIPLIVHFHGYDAYDHRILNQQGKEYPLLFEQAAAIIAVSRDMEQQLLRLGAPEKKLYYNPYGVDLNLFQATQPNKNTPIFLAVGRFVEKKAPYLTILAFKSVVQENPRARLKMIGEGELLETCKRLVQSLHLSEQVEFLGSCAHAEVATAMQTARAFVQHSVRTSSGDSEGTPVAVLEACASALPVIATRHAGIKDVVIENETGLLVNEGNIEEMSQQMLKLAENPELASRLGKAARERIEGEFSMDKSISKLWSIVEKNINS